MIIQQLVFEIQNISNSGTVEQKWHQKHQNQNQRDQKEKGRGRGGLMSALKGHLWTGPLFTGCILKLSLI